MTQFRETSATSRQAWVLRARALLDDSAAQLDAGTLSRLNRARQAALEQLDAPARRAPALLHWLGAGAVAAGIALLVWRGMLPGQDAGSLAPLAEAPTLAAPAVEVPVATPDFELLADPDSFALLEDLEFYAWLEAEEGRGG
jgi:hypothetical protein